MSAPTQEERYREALNRIADLGTCAHGKKPAYKLFQEAIDIAVSALGTTASPQAVQS